MTTENGPISSFLRKVIGDPASTTLLTVICSFVLMFVTNERSQNGFLTVIFLVIYGSSLIYSILALLVVIYKKQEEIEESKFMKKIFGGRKVFWHEIHTTATFVLFNAQLSAIPLAFGREINRPETHKIFSILNCVFFALEFFRASKAGKNYVLEENLNENRNCFSLLLGSFHYCPIVFNMLQSSCFMVSGILITSSQLITYLNVYYFQRITSTIVPSFLLFLSQIYQLNKTQNSSTLSTCGRKWQTLLLLIIATHAFLGVISLLVSTGFHTDPTMPVKEFRIDYSHHQENYHNETHDTQSNHTLGEIKLNETAAKHDNGSATTTLPTPTDPLPTIWYTTYPYHKLYYAPIEVPIPFVLTCLAFVLSVLDLYSRAIRSQSNPHPFDYNNNITMPASLSNHKRITKVEDLPTVIAASPPHFTQPQHKQHKYSI